MADRIKSPAGPTHSRRVSAEGVALAAVFGTLALIVAFVRIAEFSLMRTFGEEGFDPAQEIWSSLPVPALALVLSILAAVLVRRNLADGHPGQAGAAIALLGLCLWGLAGVASPAWLGGWMSSTVLEHLRWDVALVGATGLACHVIVQSTSGAARRAARAGVNIVAGALALFYLLEFAVLRSLGVPGLYYPLTDFFANAAGIAPILAGEVAGGGWVLLALPVALACAPMLVARGAAPASGGGARLAVWTLAPSLMLLVALPLPASAVPVESGVGRFIRSAWNGLREPADIAYGAPFDATGLRLERLNAGFPEGPRNAVVILLESVRADATTPYTPARTTTPFMDSLARAGLLVERMYAPAAYTNKALVAAFAGIPPSPEPSVGEAEAFPGGLPAVGLPALLAREGYRTAFITPADMAFERKDRILQNLGFGELFGDGDYPTEGFTAKAYFGFEDRIVLDHTMAWVDRARAGGDPFFLGMLTLTSHHPYDVPASAPHGAHGADDEFGDYLDAVAYTDAFLRDLYDRFRRRGLLESTVFIILGDHGEAFGEHGARVHGDVIWDEALHVPALAAGPGVPSGTRAGGPRTTMDVVPTVAALLGYGLVDGELPGMSLLAPVGDDRELHHSTKNGRVALALRRGAMKYIYWGGRRPMQVFDTASDPGERRDLAGTIAPAVLRGVEAELLAWRAGVVASYRAARERARAGAVGDRN